MARRSSPGSHGCAPWPSRCYPISGCTHRPAAGHPLPSSGRRGPPRSCLRGASDPVATSIVARLNPPGGNVTGFAGLEPSLAGKWLELLSEIAPGLNRAAVMFNPDLFVASVYVPSFETAARSLKVVPVIAPVHSD